MSQTDLIFNGFKRAMKPSDDLRLHEWADKHVKIIDSATGSPNFSSAQAPWVVEIMKEIEDDDNEVIVIVAPVGSGKSTVIEGMLPWAISEEPGNTIYAAHTDDKAKEWWETRALPSLKLCEPAISLLPRDRHKTRKGGIHFPHMLLKIGGATMSLLQSTSTRWVIGDEVWLWSLGRIKEALGRTHDRWNARCIFLSQASVEQDVPWSEDMGNPEFHEVWKMTDQRRARWNCRSCGKDHVWEWKDFHYDSGMDGEEERDWKTISSSVRMVCPSCEEVYLDEPATRWALTNSVTYEPMNEKAPIGYVGFTYKAQIVPWIRWGKLAREWVEANDAKKRGNWKPFRIFMQKRQSEFWKDATSGDEVEITTGGYLMRDYENGEQIDDEFQRLMAVDVQGSGGRHFWYVIRAFRRDGTSRYISSGMLQTWQDVVRTQRHYQVRNKTVFIDGQYEREEVKQWCARQGWHMLHGGKRSRFTHKIRGRAYERPYSPARKYSLSGGKSVFYWDVGSQLLKDMLYLFTRGEGLLWEVPDDVSEEYKSQMSSERKKDIMNKTTKAIERRWVRVKDDNHIWDCEAMILTGALIGGIIKEYVSHENDADYEDEE